MYLKLHWLSGACFMVFYHCAGVLDGTLDSDLSALHGTVSQSLVSTMVYPRFDVIV